jgi:hypothetical protein
MTPNEHSIRSSELESHSIEHGPLCKRVCILFLVLAGICHAEDSYFTNFALTENPISESGRWINGGTTGLDWGNVRTTHGFASAANPPYVNFNDPTAILTGNWGAIQTASVTVVCNGCDDVTFNEVEIALNRTLTAHKNDGYEINCRTPDNSSAYFCIVRWNGALGDFTILRQVIGKGCKNGDVFSATNVNGVITGFLNGVAVITATDTTFSGGAPGIGFDSCGPPQTPAQCTNSFRTYGISSFSASSAPPFWSGRHYNLKMLPLFVFLSLSLFLFALVAMALIFRDVFSFSNEGDQTTFRRWAGRKFRLGSRAINNVWKEHARSFPQSKKRSLFAFFLVAAAISAMGYALWLVETSSRTIALR